MKNKFTKIVFLYNSESRLGGSVRARVIQMASLVTEIVIELGFDISVKTSFHGIFDSLVIVHKSMIGASTVNSLALLKTRNCILVADPVDGKFHIDDFLIYDAVVSASFSQIDWILKNAPTKKVFFINQRIDKRFPTCKQNKIKFFKIGYFGALVNCAHINAITGVIDLIETPTQSISWMNRLNDYSMHYAVRPNVEGVFKPFGKGYIAGRYSCPVIVGSDEPDAVHLLPNDYPYWVNSSDSDAVLDVIEKANSEFNSNSWNYAKETLGKVSSLATDDNIESQFSTMILDLLNAEGFATTMQLPEIVIQNYLIRASRFQVRSKNKLKKALFH